VGNLRERDHLEDTGTDGRIILTCIFRKQDGSVDWIYVAQNRDKRRALVNTVMNLGVSYNVVNFSKRRDNVGVSGRTLLDGITL
jgi:hypothetical protein